MMIRCCHLLWALLCIALPVAAFPPGWQHELTAPAGADMFDPPRPTLVATGSGFEIRRDGWVAVYDDAGQRLRTVRDNAVSPGQSRQMSYGFGRAADSAEAIDVLPEQATDWLGSVSSCIRTVRSDGRAVRNIRVAVAESSQSSLWQGWGVNGFQSLDADGSGYLWGLSGPSGSSSLRRFGEDCSAHTVLPQVGTVAQVAARRDEAGVFLLSLDAVGTTLRMVGQNGDGWQIALTEPFDEADVLMTPGPAGGVLLAAAEESGQTEVRRYAADGALSWSTSLEIAGEPLALQARSEGIALILRQAEADVQLWLDPIGNTSGIHPLLHGRYIADVPQMGAAVSDPLWLVGTPPQAHQHAKDLHVLEPAVGEAPTSVSAIPEPMAPVARLQNGNLLLDNATGALWGPSAMLLHADGTALALDPQPALPPPRWIAMSYDEHGEVWLFSPSGEQWQASGPAEWELHAFSPDGELQWAKAVDPSNLGVQLALSAERACVVGKLPDEPVHLQCLDRVTGEVRLDARVALTPLDRLRNPWVRGARLGNDDALYIYASQDSCDFSGFCTGWSALTLSRFSASGELQSFELLPDPREGWFPDVYAPPRGSEDILLIPTLEGTRHLRVNAEGNVVSNIVLPGSEEFLARTLGRTPDGALLLEMLDENQNPQVVHVDPAGSVRWRNSQPSGAAVFVAGGWALRARLSASGFDLQFLEADSGAVRWQRGIGFASVVGRSGGDRVGVVNIGDDNALRWLDPENGALIATTGLDPARQTDSLYRYLPRDKEQGVLLIEALTQGTSARLRLRVEPADRFDGAESPETMQQALNGSWFEPAISGQGLYFDALPGAGAVFGAWFTYTLGGGDGTDALSWYTLFGEVEPGATYADLEIIENAGGRFDQGGGVASTTVGHARLRLNSCDEAVLEYTMESGDAAGQQRTRLLRRLLPRGVECTRGTADPLPPAQPVAAADGFDVASAGSWYEPATSGQGVLMELMPPQASGDGVLTAGWFTYDPEAADNDERAQHWFLLNGPLVAGSAGEAQLTILQTIGGEFETGVTSNSYRVGEAAIRFHACDRATLEYAFDEDELAGSFAGRSGSIELSRTLPCG